MKYWKEGFYETKISGSVEITDEYWMGLLDAQSEGKQIVTGDDGVPIAIFPVVTSEQLISQAKEERDSLISQVEWRRSRHNDEVSLGLEPTEPLQPILEYIQALREVPKQDGFPVNVVWPVPLWEDEVINS